MPRRKLIVGETDLATTHPNLASELVDLDPTTIQAGSNKKPLWRCPQGHTWNAMVLSRSKDGRGCPYCSGYIPILGVNDLATLRPDLSSQMVSHDPKTFKEFSNKKVTWRCKEGHEWEALISNRTKHNSGCPYCTGSIVTKGINDLKSQFPELSKELVIADPEKLFSMSNTKVVWGCKHKHQWKASVASRTRNNTGCPYCSGRVRTIGYNTLDVVNPKLSSELVHKDRAKFIAPKSHKPEKWFCTNGHTWNTSPNNRSRGRGCPICTANSYRSIAEKEIFDFIRENYEGVVSPSVRNIIKGELDIYLPELNIAVEYNGVYYHSEVFKSKDYHKNKVEACREKGIQLISIWEDDYTNNKAVVLRMLSHKLGISSQSKVPARKTYPTVITNTEAKVFLDYNHIQGFASGSYYLGLKAKYDDELVAVMVLTRIKDTLLLDRYATSCIVMGGQSKLLSYVDSNIDYDHMTTFADLSVSDGYLYEKTGWTKDKVIPPDYRYLVSGKREHKFNYRIKRFRTDPGLKFEEGLTERELAKLNNLHRVYDCGKIRYVRRNPNELHVSN